MSLNRVELNTKTRDMEEQMHQKDIELKLQRKNFVIEIENGEKYWILTPVPVRDEEESNLRWLKKCQKEVTSGFSRYWTFAKWALIFLFVLGYSIYLGFVFTRTNSGWTALIVLTCFAVILFIYEKLKALIGLKVQRRLILPLSRTTKNIWRKVKWLVCPCLLAGLAVYLSLVVIKSWTQVLAIVGYCLFASLTLITSSHVTQIRWRPVVVGLGLQVALAVVLLRFSGPYRAAHWLGNQVGALLRHSLRGGTTALGNPTAFFHPLLMVVCPVIIYLGATMAFLSHVGILPYLCGKMSWAVRAVFGVSKVEAKALGEGIFSGMMDHVMTLRPYVKRLTPSELQLTMVMAHSNLYSFMYGLFSIFWVSTEDLLLGALMAAPAGVALSKMNAPEVHQTLFPGSKDIAEDKEERNIFERTALGALKGGKVVAAIVIQIIAFLSMYELFDVILSWIGDRASIDLSFKVIFSHLFMPIAYLLGVPWSEVKTASYLLGLVLSQNELIAYLELGALRMGNTITKKTSAICTVAVCGFSNFASMTLTMGGWYAACPATYRRTVGCLYRVYLVAKMASLTTACLFGIFYDEALIKSFEDGLDISTAWLDVGRLLSIIPSYKELLPWLGLQI